jgi:hypothetical protein
MAHVYSKPVPWRGSAEEKLEFMREHGTSVLLNWGEDDNLWEASWITDGERHTAFSSHLVLAVHQVLQYGTGTRVNYP